MCSLVLAGAILAWVGGMAAAAENGGSPFMSTIGKTTQPIGHYEFCRSRPGECAVRSAGKRRIALTATRLNMLAKVNTDINRAVVPATDDEIFGRPEVWAYPAGSGDCEDVALAKRRTLIEMGWPVNTLLITVVRRPNGEGHAVLTVLTDRGDLVLDNIEPRVLVWNETPYQYVKRQSERDTGAWLAINDARTVTVGSMEP